MTKKQRAAIIVERLAEVYPDNLCSLDYQTDWQLLFAARLSAQCTDARVNIITPMLFKLSLQDIADSDVETIEAIVKSCGFYRAKARDIVLCAQQLLAVHGGKVPQDMNKLLALPGVGRKTANLLRGDLFGLPAIVADTHCIRISNRIGLTTSTNPAIVEAQLIKIVASAEQNDLCHRFVLFGRETCKAPKPRCELCPLQDVCKLCTVKRKVQSK